MKLLILAIFAVAAVSAVENYNGPEWQEIDWSKVIPVTEMPGFWDNTVFAQIYPKPNARAPRIVGGEEAQPNAHPYQVAQLQTWIIFQTLCGGSVISPNHILTAAHCPIGTSTTTVITGAHNMNRVEETQQRRTVPSANYRIHPNYNNQNLNNDIAILVMDSPLTFNQFVQPIAMAESNAGAFVGVRAQATGWGRVADGQGTSNVLRVVQADIISNEACAAVFGPTVVNDAVLCIDTAGGRGTCNGDSGGVLSVLEGSTRVQVGVTSFGSSAGCELGFPAGFERVSAQRSWIDQTMQ